MSPIYDRTCQFSLIGKFVLVVYKPSSDVEVVSDNGSFKEVSPPKQTKSSCQLSHQYHCQSPDYPTLFLDTSRPRNSAQKRQWKQIIEAERDFTSNEEDELNFINDSIKGLYKFIAIVVSCI